MKKIVVIFFILFVPAGASMTWWLAKNSTATPIVNRQMQTANLGAVTVEVRPEKLGRNEQENIFAVNFNTHSVNLDFDFTKLMILSDNLGNNYQGLAWNGERGGHHLSGEIIFPKLKPGVKKVILQIAKIDGQEANFEWPL